jgi:hypothetical protein
MQNVKINIKNGLFTEIDDYNNPGAVDLSNVLIKDTLSKSKGFKLSNSDAVIAIDYIKIEQSTASLAVVSFYTDSVPADDDIIGLPYLVYDDDNENVATVCNDLSNTFVKIDAVTASCFAISYAFSSFGSTFTSSEGFNAFIGIKDLHGLVSDYIDIEDISIQGAFYDKDSDLIYAFISNNITSKSYLIKSDKDTNNFTFVEGSTTASCTEYGNTYDAEFIKYENDIIFTKNEKKLIASAYGGVHYIDGTNIKLYGEKNNPTGATIEVFADRIAVGNISYEGNTAVDGGSWLIRSKIYPEKTDTEFSISAISFASNGEVGVATITATGHTFLQDDYIFLDDIVHTGINELNKNYYQIKGIEANKFTIHTQGKGYGYTSGGTAILRGNNWLPSTSLFLPDSVQAGIIKCDDNNSDKIVKIKKSFTSLILLRERNPYILNDNDTLARQLNIEYGTLSKSVAQSANGFYFVSQYGISNVAGTSINENPNQLDNITGNLVSNNIKRLFDKIIDKSKIILNFNNVYIWVHDKSMNNTFVLDTTTGQWTKYTETLADEVFNIGNDIYSIYKGFIFKHEQEYTKFNMYSFSQEEYLSKYKTKIYDLDNDQKKEFIKLYFLIKGVNSINNTSDISINLYYNGSNNISNSLIFDIKTGTDETWQEFLSSSDTWLTALSESDTWVILFGSSGRILEKGARRLGFGRLIQFEIEHSAIEEFNLNGLTLFYNLLNIE